MFFYMDLPMEPKAKGRPRVSGGVAYTPHDTVAWAKDAVVLMKAAHTTGAVVVPCSISMLFVFAAPKKAEQSQLGTPCIKRPDGDNVEKMVLDCLVKAGIIADDCLVTQASWRKEWGKDGFIRIAVTAA